MSAFSEVDRDVAVILSVIRFDSKDLNISGNLFVTFKVESFESLDKALAGLLKKHRGSGLS